MKAAPAFAGTYRSGATTLAIEPVGEAFHLVWREAGHTREGCGIGVGDWLYAVRSREGAATAKVEGLAGLDFDARTGVIVYEVQRTGQWPATFYHPKDGGKLTCAVSGNAPETGLVGEFVVGYEARTGEKRDAVIKTIAKDGERYRFTWAKNGLVLYEGIGLDLGPRFAAAWGAPGQDHELAILHREAGILACTRTSLAGETVTTERFA